ncbi:hypothetical protein B0H21DRAFT_818854 [Amylocystis lapponica]|nr:hypothetical protein B0H21DRAFT_818854 [Amylocystis lapponica]
MSASVKLTKKQKKALAFRERKGKGRARAPDEDNDVPVAEDQDRVEAEMQVRTVEDQAHGKTAPKSRGGKAEEVVVGGQSAKKRKREKDETTGGPEQSKPEKKRKRVDGEGDGAGVGTTGEETAQTKEKLKQRNLKYTTAKEAIEKHFAACDPPPTIRLITPKPSSSGKPTTKSKGCAFLEFSHRNALQQGLKLHQSELEGRKINVELTAGGGGKSESRTEKLKKRNRELHEQRTKQLEKKSKTSQERADPECRSTDHNDTRPRPVLSKRHRKRGHGLLGFGRGGRREPKTIQEGAA